MAASPAMEELRIMVATSAIYDGERDEEDDYTRVCHPGTREDHLRDLTTWANNAPPATGVAWLNAIAGAGKTAMLRTFCTELEEQSGIPPVSFFVWKGDARRNSLKHFPATIAYQLCQIFQVLVPHIEKAINAAPLLLQSAFKKQMDKLIIGPLLNASDTIKEERHLVFVVDGLDELDEKSLSDFLSFIPYFLSRLSSLPISLLISSRPDAEIVAAFQHPDLASITAATRLGASDEDIWKFINDKFDSINLRYPNLQIEYGGQWPSHAKRVIMVKQSSGLFIWPTVAIDYIDKVKLGLGHNARLEQVLSSAEPKPWVASPLDNLYRTILEAHAPQEPAEFFRFKQRLARLCLPVDLTTGFVRACGDQLFNWTNTPVRAIFKETLDELWGSVAGLSSLFSPRTPLYVGESSATPAVSHRSLQDFTFNRARCGDKLYYSSEQELHTEVVCNFIKFFNACQPYESSTDMGTVFMNCVHDLMERHLKEAGVSEELGYCMDDVTLEVIPPTWPLVAQVYLIVKLFGSLYDLAGNFDFPEGPLRREALLKKCTVFFKSRAAKAEEWDNALFRLALSTANLNTNLDDFQIHSVQCWCVSHSQCTCLDAYMRNVRLEHFQDVFSKSTFLQHARSRMVENRQDDVTQDCLNALQFFLSLSETSPPAAELAPFMPVRTDYWIGVLLGYCAPNSDLCDALGPVCAAPLPDCPRRDPLDFSWRPVDQYLQQTAAFIKYIECCREAGIETNLSPIKIPDDWWHDTVARERLLKFGYHPSIEIQDDWWEGRFTRGRLLENGNKPPFDIPEVWWQEGWTRDGLLAQLYEPPFDIPYRWWQNEKTRQILRRRGYPPPGPYSADDTASESSDSSAEEEEPAVQDVEADRRGSPQVQPPSSSLSNPLHIQPAYPAHPTTSPSAELENVQAVPLNVVACRHHRGFRGFLKGLSCF